MFAFACEPAPAPPVLVLSGDTIALPGDVRTHEVDLRVRADGEFRPAAITAAPGDILRLTTSDGRGHAVVFDGAAGDTAIAWLERTGQRRSPPLLDTGATWIIDLTGAPVGDYRISCLIHGEHLLIHVLEP